MSSNSVCNLTRDQQIGLPLRGRPILLSLVWLQTEWNFTQSYYHYLNFENHLNCKHEIVCLAWPNCPAGFVSKNRPFVCISINLQVIFP